MADKPQKVRARAMKIAITTPKEMATLLLIVKFVEVVSGGLMVRGMVASGLSWKERGGTEELGWRYLLCLSSRQKR